MRLRRLGAERQLEVSLRVSAATNQDVDALAPEGRRMAAAQALGLSYPTFLKRLRELGVASE